MNKVNYDNYAKTFSKSRLNMKWPEIDFILGFFKSNFLNINNKPIKILDLGCGNGRLINYLGEYFGDNYEYLGLDFSKNMINEAKLNFPDKDFIIGDMSEFILDKKYLNNFDLIIGLASFHHLLDNNIQTKCLNNLSKYINNNGIIAFTNWNLNSNFNIKKYTNRKGERGNSEVVTIKIGDNLREYYSFEILELEKLFLESKYNILHNEVFNTGRNIISIIKK